MGTPRAPGKADGGTSGMTAQVARSGRGMYLRLLPRESAVHVSQKFRTLEPPVTEELGVERRHHDGVAVGGLSSGNAGEEMGEVLRVPSSPVGGCLGIVGLLLSQIHVAAGDSPELEPTGPAHLVEFQIPLVSRVTFEPAPYLHRGLGITDVRDQRPVSNAVRPIGRTQSFGRPCRGS